MRPPRIELADRLQRLRHPGRLSLGDAAQRLGVPEGWVAEALATSGGTLPGGTRVMRLTTGQPDSLLATLIAGGPVVVGVGEQGNGGWRLARSFTVLAEHPALRIRWDQAELVLPAADLHAYAIIEPTACRCGERRVIAWYDAVGRGLARIMQRIESDPAAYETCVAGYVDATPATWADPGPSTPPRPAADRQSLPSSILSRIATDLGRATDMSPVTMVLGHQRYMLVQHGSTWTDRSSGRNLAFSDGVGCVHLWQDAIAEVAIVQVPALGPLHAIEAYDVVGQRCLAIVPQRAVDDGDPVDWADLIAGWRDGAS